VFLRSHRAGAGVVHLDSQGAAFGGFLLGTRRLGHGGQRGEAEQAGGEQQDVSSKLSSNDPFLIEYAGTQREVPETPAGKRGAGFPETR